MKNIKWIIGISMMVLSIYSCLDDEPILNAVYSYKAIDSVQVGEIHPARQVTEIKTFYTQTNNCEDFFNYEYAIDQNQRQVTMVVSKIQSENCDEVNQAASNVLQFKPEFSGNYIFRFWKGQDENGENLYIEREIEIP